jgi:hypothetical protein
VVPAGTSWGVCVARTTICQTRRRAAGAHIGTEAFAVAGTMFLYCEKNGLGRVNRGGVLPRGGSVSVRTYWQPPQSFVPIVTGEGRVVIMDSGYLITPSDQLEPCTRHYVVAANSRSKAIMLNPSENYEPQVSLSRRVRMIFSTRWSRRSSPRYPK